MICKYSYVKVMKAQKIFEFYMTEKYIVKIIFFDSFPNYCDITIKLSRLVYIE